MPKTKVLVNGTDVSELITDMSTEIEFSTDYLIGNTPSKLLNLKVNNQNGEFNLLLDSPFILQREDGTRLGTFYVIEKPERMTGEMTLELYDSMCKANVEYASNLVYPTTIEYILDDISTNLGIQIDHTRMDSSVLEKVVNAYDSTQTIRVHLCWLAELGAGNFFADNYGNYVFIPLSKNKVHDLPPDDVEKFERIEPYTLTAVTFDNGIFAISQGNDVGNVYKVDENNLYIDSQVDIDNIYNHISGLAFHSSNALKCSHIEGLQLGEIINVANDFNIMPLSIKQTYLNATYDIQEISGEISTKNKESLKQSNNYNKQIRRVQANIDQTNNNINFLAQDISDTYASKTEMNLTASGINTTISETKTELEDKIKTVTDKQVEYEQGISGFGAVYVKQTTYQDDMNNLVTTGKLTKYFRYDAEYVEYEQEVGALLIGYKDESNNIFNEIKVNSVGMGLLENGEKMVYVENNQTLLKNATIRGYLQIGESNGLKWIEEDDPENGWSLTI